MFRKHSVKRANVNIAKRKWKPSKSNPDWDSTITDLTVYKATPAEIRRRRLVHKSKNADAAKRALGERAKMLFTRDASPSQVELEMRKLAILKEVLYDHDDLNEVLRRVDQTMTSVKNDFHDPPSRKPGIPHLTMAPGAKGGHQTGPVHVTEEPPTQMSLLSDSVMDKQALNDEVFSSDEEDDDIEEEKFESKVDYERFLGLLRESLSKSAGGGGNKLNPGGDLAMTPVEKTKEQQRQALNCTEEVKRTISRLAAAGESQAPEKDSTRRKIDETIAQTRNTKHTQLQEAAKKHQTVSFSMSDNTLPPRANLTTTNMTYENLQEAMESVNNTITEIETRRGKATEVNISSITTDGLTGFTATLIDAVTRLTLYVNEAEIKIKENDMRLEEMKNQNDHQRALLDALTAELMSMQLQINSIKEESSKQAEESKQREKALRDVVEEEINEVKKKLDEMMKNQEVATDGSGDNNGLSQPASRENGLDNVDNHMKFEMMDEVNSTNLRDEDNLKSDMLSLIGALKTHNAQPAQQAHTTEIQYLPMNNDTTKAAAQTVASVESQLRHLQLQHAEAQSRLQELTQVAGLLANKVAETEKKESERPSENETKKPEDDVSNISISTGSITPQRPLEDSDEGFHFMIPSSVAEESDDAMSAITLTSSVFATAGGDAPGPSDLSSRVGFGMRRESEFSIDSDPKVTIPGSNLSEKSLSATSDTSYEEQPHKIPFLFQSNVFGIKPAPKPTVDENLDYFLKKPVTSKPSAISPFRPTAVPLGRTQDSNNMVNSIQRTQCNLEERIAELNKQHAEAQSRLQNLVKKRSDTSSISSSASSGFRRVIQVTLPTDDMLKTPQIYKPAMNTSS